MSTDEQTELNTSVAGGEQFPDLFRAVVVQSPVSTWIADKNGTLIFEDAANRRLFGISSDDAVIGRFNIFRDEEIIRQGLAPQIRQVFEQGGSAEFTLDYDFSQVRSLTDAHPVHRFLRVLMFSIAGQGGNVHHVVFQQEDYTERHHAEMALAESESRYRQIVENLTDWVWEVDLDGRFTYSNAMVKQILGYGPDEVVGRSVFEFLCPEDHERVRQILRKAVERRHGFQAVIHRMRHENGTSRSIESSGTPVLNSDGELVGFRGIDRDITGRIQIEQALKESEARLRAFVDNIPFDIWALDKDGRYILQNPTSIKHWGNHIGKTPNDVAIPQEVKSDWLRNNARALAGETVHDEVTYHIEGEDKTYYSVIAPIVEDQKVIGTLGINVDITNRKRAEEALADAEAKYRTLVEKSLVGVYIIQDGKLAYANPVLAEIFGYGSPSEMEGSSALDTVAPEDRAMVMENITRRVSDEVQTIRYCFHGLRRDDRRIIVEVLGSRITYHGKPAVIGSLLDITERVEAENQLRASEAELRALICAMPDVILVLDKNGIYRKIAPTNPDLLYKPSDELLGRSLHEVFPPETADEFLAAIHRALETRNTQHIEYPLMIGGREIWFSAYISPMTDDEVIWVARDITEQKKAQEAERRRQQDLETLINTMPGYAFLKNANGTYVAANQAFARAVGLTPGEIAGKTDYDLFPKDLADKYRKDDQEVIETGMPLLVGEEEMTEDNNRITVLTRKVPLKDETGKVTALIGLGFDITELKRAEEALRRSEENFRAIFNYAPALIVTYDRSAVVLEVNQAFERFVGYPREQLVGRSMFETFARPELLKQKEDVITRVFAGETVQDSEWVAVRPNDTKVYALVNTTPVYDSRGNISKALAMGVDITERKQSEQYQRELDQHKREFYRRTILAATEGKLVIAERDEILRIAGRTLKTWNIVSGEELGVIRHDVMEMALDAGMDESRVYDFVLAVGEMSTNALKHAGGGEASLHKPDDELVFIVSDHGQGIEALTLPEVALVRGYSTAGTLGMGYKAVLSVADRVYLATGPQGTMVAVEMKLHPAERPKVGASLPDTWMTQK